MKTVFFLSIHYLSVEVFAGKQVRTAFQWRHGKEFGRVVGVQIRNYIEKSVIWFLRPCLERKCEAIWLVLVYFFSLTDCTSLTFIHWATCLIAESSLFNHWFGGVSDDTVPPWIDWLSGKSFISIEFSSWNWLNFPCDSRSFLPFYLRLCFYSSMMLPSLWMPPPGNAISPAGNDFELCCLK